MQNKCSRYCLQLVKMALYFENQFEILKDRFFRSINYAISNYFTNKCSIYFNEISEAAWKQLPKVDMSISQKLARQQMHTFSLVLQNKCNRYCLQLVKMVLYFKNQFEILKDRFFQSINYTIFKYFTNQCSIYFNEVFETAWKQLPKVGMSISQKLARQQMHTFSLVLLYGIKPQRFYSVQRDQ